MDVDRESQVSSNLNSKISQNEMMEEKNVNNIVGVQLMARDNIYMVLVEYKYVKDVQEEVGCMMRSVGWTA